MPRSSWRNRHMRRSPTTALELLSPFDYCPVGVSEASVAVVTTAAGQRGKLVGGWSVFWSSLPGA
jgi:hypothetical protein